MNSWERALQEGKEVLVALDANIDDMTWRMQDSLPKNNSSVRLKPLIDELFTRIIPLGVTQMVTCATRLQRGQPKTGLDHLYTNKVENLFSIQTFLKGTSDHKLIKVIRFSKSFKQLPRYVKKRAFKDFDEQAFRLEIKNCGLEEVLLCSEVDKAAELLTNKLTEILDQMAPIKKFQTRKNYAPWMSKDTKILKNNRDLAHKRAIETDKPEDWRMFKNIRNQVTAKLRKDKSNWEAKKLDLNEQNPTGVWQAVKGWLGWNTGGTPTQLFYDGRLLSSPVDLSSAMNNFFLNKIEKLREKIPLTSIAYHVKSSRKSSFQPAYKIP